MLSKKVQRGRMTNKERLYQFEHVDKEDEKFIAPPSSQTVKEADLGRVLSINHQFLKLQIYNPTKTLKRPISTTKIKH